MRQRTLNGTHGLKPVQYSAVEHSIMARATSPKYQDALTERLYMRSLDSAQDEETGTVDELGWYALFRNTCGGHIIMEDNYGFVYSESFRSTAKLNARWASIEAQYAAFDSEDEDA